MRDMTDVRKKVSFFEWVLNGEATFPARDYSFFAGAMGLADTLPKNTVAKKYDPTFFDLPNAAYLILKNETFQTTTRKNILSGLKIIDIFIQVFSGTLLFGALQNLGERIRDPYKYASGPIAWTAGVIGGAFALIGRLGVFVTQVLAGAIRFPFAIISGAIGTVRGIYLALTNKDTNMSAGNIITATIGDYVWPFAPKAGEGIAIYLTSKQFENSNLSIKDTTGKLNKITTNRWIGIASLAIAITLVALLATGTLGAGLGALPAVNYISNLVGVGLNAAINGIAVGINYIFGAGTVGTTHLFASGAGKMFGGLPVLNGIASTIGLGVFSKKAVIATMLVGALTTFFGNVMHAVKDNVQAIWTTEAKKKNGEGLEYGETIENSHTSIYTNNSWLSRSSIKKVEVGNQINDRTSGNLNTNTNTNTNTNQKKSLG